ncbi:MAG: CaiB/BaiF CoA transferase family protein [Actinomycetota bacterium]
MSRPPLDGVRILDLTRLLPGGYATLLLADLGADVIKVEEPGKGDYVRWSPPRAGQSSAAHLALNRNKRSITLNLRSDPARRVFLDLVARSDVVIESFRPGVMDRLGVGWEALRKRKPALIYCAITGYGQDGPRAGVAGHDLNYIGHAGVLGITGERGGPPVIPGVQIGDLAGGGMAAVIAILAALHKRDATGEGDFCDVSMLDGLVSWLTIHAAAFVATGEAPRRGEMPLSGLYPCYRLYPAADGWLTVGALEPRFWERLCDALDRSDLAGDAYATGERGAEVVAELEERFATRTRSEWMQQLDGLDVCVGPVNDMAEVFADDQVRSRAMVVDEQVPGVGPWRHLGTPIKLRRHPGQIVRRPPPEMGEHTDEVLREIGVDGASLAELRAAGAV